MSLLRICNWFVLQDVGAVEEVAMVPCQDELKDEVSPSSFLSSAPQGRTPQHEDKLKPNVRYSHKVRTIH